MGCDLVFKINGRLNGGLFDEQPSDLNVTIKDSEIMSDIYMYSYSDTFKSVHQLSLVNVARQLMKNKTEYLSLEEVRSNIVLFPFLFVCDII